MVTTRSNLNLSKSLIALPQSLDLSPGHYVMLKSPLMIHLQSLGRLSAIKFHKCCRVMGILGAYTHVVPMHTISPKPPSLSAS